MTDTRKSDNQSRAWFRSPRFFKQQGEWFFYTREGTMEGPFSELQDAENRLNEYIRIMTSGFMPDDSELNLEPLAKKKDNNSIGQK